MRDMFNEPAFVPIELPLAGNRTVAQPEQVEIPFANRVKRRKCKKLGHEGFKNFNGTIRCVNCGEES